MSAKSTQPLDIDGNLHVLLIVQEKDIQLIISHHLSKIGFRNVIPLPNGYEALKFRKNFDEEISLTICGNKMAHLNGLDYLDEVRNSPDISAGPFLLILEEPSDAEIALASEHGVNSILVKPFTLEQIPVKLQSAYFQFHDPKNPDKLFETAKSHLKSGELDQAEGILNRLYQSLPTKAKSLVMLARVDLSRNKYEEGLKKLVEAETENSKFFPLYNLRADICLKMDDEEGAIKALKQAINISPLNPVRYDTVGELLSERQRFKEIIELLNIAYAYDMDFPSMHHYLSQANLSQKNYADAMRHIRLALYKDKDNLKYLNQLGICYKAQEMYDDAMSTYNQIIKLDPKNKSALYNKANLLAAEGDTENAIKLLERVISLHPEFRAARVKIKDLRRQAKSA